MASLGIDTAELAIIKLPPLPAAYDNIECWTVCYITGDLWIAPVTNMYESLRVGGNERDRGVNAIIVTWKGL